MQERPTLRVCARGSSPAGITFDERSVGVSAAHLRGKQEGRVQFPDRPLDQTTRAAGPMGRRLTCNQEIGVRFPGGPLNKLGVMVQREDTAMAWRKSEFDSRSLH